MRSMPFSSALFEEDFDDSKEEKELQFWRSQMDALSAGKVSWEEFFQGIPLLNHPARSLTTTDTGYSLLHLAILSNRFDLVQSLLEMCPHLKWKRCALEWTPLNFVKFLQRQDMLSFFEAPRSPSFYEQPNIGVVDSDRLEKLSSLTFLHQPVFESDEIFHEIVKQTKKTKAENGISTEKIWMGVYFDKELQKGIHPKVSIQFIDEKVGFGVFAQQKIAPCSFVGEYAGVIKERKKKELKGKEHAVRFAGWDMGRSKYIVDAEKMGNFTRFINHSESPNLSLQSVYWKGILRMIFVATQNISEGAQLTFDYGTFFWKDCCQIPTVF